jgi:carboxylesterase type B
LGDAEALAAIPNKKIVGMLMQKFLFRGGSPYGKMSATKLPFAGAYGTAFLPHDVLDAMASGAARHIDLLVGTARHDGRALSLSMPGPRALTTINV